MTNCLNCDNELAGDYCERCGQKAATHRYSMHEWLHEIPHTLLHVDGNFPLTVKTLTVRGGEAVREFLAGKRKLLYSPFIYVLVWCGVFVVVSHFFASAEKQLATPTNFREAQAFIEEKYYKIIVIAMIVPLAIGSFVAYIRSGYNFAEHLVVNAFLMGQLVIADIVLTLVAATPFDDNFRIAFKVLEFLLKYPFWFWFYWRVFRPSKWYWGILQYIAAILVGGIALSILTAGAALIMLKTGAAH